MQHKIVSRDEWLAARKAHLKSEKALTRMRDLVSAERRALPWVKVDKEYVFDTLHGKRTLAQLFEGRSQLVVKHFMLGPDWEQGCVGCSFHSDHIDGANLHLPHNDVTLIAVSRALLAKIEAYKQRMGWRFTWVSSFGSDFNYDYHVSFTPEEIANHAAEYNYETSDVGIDELSGLSVFYRDESGDIFHTYSSYGRGNEEVMGAYIYLDIAPKGRNENGPRHDLMDWVRRHDEYPDPRTDRNSAA